MECGTGTEQQKLIQDFILISHLNLALCYLRIKDLSQVVENCNKVSSTTLMAVCVDAMLSFCFWMFWIYLSKVIELDESNEKALFRRGEARLLRNEFSLAMADFQQVLQVNPSNRAARTQISICQCKIKEHHEQDKRTYANMFQKFAERDAKVCELFLAICRKSSWNSYPFL